MSRAKGFTLIELLVVIAVIFIETNKTNPGAHSGIETASPDNEDLRWLVEHFWSKERGLR